MVFRSRTKFDYDKNAAQRRKRLHESANLFGGVFAFDSVCSELDVFGRVVEVEQLTGAADRRLRQSHGHASQQRPLMRVTISGELDVQIGPPCQRVLAGST